MKVAIFDADDPNDAALVNSHWVAEQTIARLGASVGRSVRGTEVTRAAMEQSLADEAITGVVYFGHGNNVELVANGSAVLDRDNLAQARGTWIHAFACMAGNDLAASAKEEGVDAFLGYSARVRVEWDVADLPSELRALLQRLVTVATERLHDGERSTKALRNSVRDAYDDLVAWLDDHAEELSLRVSVGISLLEGLERNAVFVGMSVLE